MITNDDIKQALVEYLIGYHGPTLNSNVDNALDGLCIDLVHEDQLTTEQPWTVGKFIAAVNRLADTRKQMTNPHVTASDREAAFRRDLAELLAKHGAEIQIAEHQKGWYSRSYIYVTLDGEFTPDGDQVKEYADFEL